MSKCLLALAMVSMLTAASPSAEPAPSADGRFSAVDVFIDAGAHPLAAYQLDFHATTDNVQIVGIEGGHAPAFAQPPYYDPRAMMNDHVLLAAFTTDDADNLPTGRTRVATIHVYILDNAAPDYVSTLQVAATTDGTPIDAEISHETRSDP